MIVLSYYDPVPGINSSSDLIPLWTKAWEKLGAHAFVLSKHDALYHSRFVDFDLRFKTFPSVNPPGYDLACYHRWLAVDEHVQVHGGRVLAVDLDVFPRFLGPFTALNDVALAFHDPARVPCAITLNRVGSAAVLDALHAGPKEPFLHDGRPHCSDMLILQKSPENPLVTGLCKEYGDEGWETSALVHFPHSRTGPDKVSAVKKVFPDL